MSLLDVVVKIFRREESAASETPSGDALYLTDVNGLLLKTADGYYLAVTE